LDRSDAPRHGDDGGEKPGGGARRRHAAQSAQPRGEKTLAAKPVLSWSKGRQGRQGKARTKRNHKGHEGHEGNLTKTFTGHWSPVTGYWRIEPPRRQDANKKATSRR